MKSYRRRITHLLLYFALFSTSITLGQIQRGKSPEELGVSSSGILKFVEALENQEDATHGFVILRKGYVVAEGWWAPYHREAPHKLYSLSKSFTSTAIGMLSDEGKIDIDDPVVSFFPDDIPKDPSDHLKFLRVRDLLTMTTGHQQDATRFMTLGDEQNWPKVFLAQAIEKRPGTRFRYNTSATYMLSAILQKLTGKTVKEYLSPRLFKPLGINNASWESDPQGINVGGWGLKVSTTDIANFGQLYLQKGVWNQQRLISKSWIQLATSAQTKNGTNPDNDWNQGYGFQFWRCRHNGYRGDGLFGQFCIVMPEEELVVAITAGQRNMAKSMNLVWDHVLPALSSKKLPPNPTLQKSLKDKLKKLNLPTVKGKASSILAGKISGKKFTLAENSAKIKTITFNFDENKSWLNLQTEQVDQTFKLGHGKWGKSVVPFHKLGISTVSTTGKEPTFSSAAWTTPQKFTVRSWMIETPYRLDMEFAFEGEGSALEMTYRIHPAQPKAIKVKSVSVDK